MIRIKIIKASSSSHCPRCGGFVGVEWNDLICINCGWRQSFFKIYAHHKRVQDKYNSETDILSFLRQEVKL